LNIHLERDHHTTCQFSRTFSDIKDGKLRAHD
jgi:hypothetical protein